MSKDLSWRICKYSKLSPVSNNYASAAAQRLISVYLIVVKGWRSLSPPPRGQVQYHGLPVAAHAKLLQRHLLDINPE